MNARERGRPPPFLPPLKPLRVPRHKIHQVTGVDSGEFPRLLWAIRNSCVVGLDAEWKPVTSRNSFPIVSLLQIACLLVCNAGEGETGGPVVQNGTVFLVDLRALPLPTIVGALRELFSSPNILKLGFRFKQDLAYLSSTFSSQGCESAFEKVEPYLDIASIYNLLHNKHHGRRTTPKQSKSLARISEEVLGVHLSKELQCSDWSHRPLDEEQILYAAADVHCLLEIFIIFQSRFLKIEGSAKQLHCVEIDAATPHSKKPEARQLIEQAVKENRVLLTRDRKLLNHQCLSRNHIYKVKNLVKEDQLIEVIETFQLKICEEQLMSRCIKCNGRFIQKPLTEETIAAARGMQVIPECLYNRNFEFWQRENCGQQYWELK